MRTNSARKEMNLISIDKKRQNFCSGVRSWRLESYSYRIILHHQIVRSPPYKFETVHLLINLRPVTRLHKLLQEVM